MRVRSRNPKSPSKPTAWRPRLFGARKPPDLGPLYRASREVATWALDVAEAQVRGFREEKRAVRNVRRFVEATLAGKRCAPVAEEEVVFTIGLLITALDIHCGESRVIDAIEAALLGFVPAEVEAEVVPLFRNSCDVARALRARWAA